VPWGKLQIRLKTPDEVAMMAASGRLLADIFLAIRELVRPGVTTSEIDREVESMIRDAAAYPRSRGTTVFRRRPVSR